MVSGILPSFHGPKRNCARVIIFAIIYIQYVERQVRNPVLIFMMILTTVRVNYVHNTQKLVNS